VSDFDGGRDFEDLTDEQLTAYVRWLEACWLAWPNPYKLSHDLRSSGTPSRGLMQIMDQRTADEVRQRPGGPAPDRPVGSLWYDPLSGTGYVRTDTRGGAYRGFAGRYLFGVVDSDSPMVKRLTPWADRPDAGLDGRTMPRCDCQDDPS